MTALAGERQTSPAVSRRISKARLSEHRLIRIQLLQGINHEQGINHDTEHFQQPPHRPRARSAHPPRDNFRLEQRGPGAGCRPAAAAHLSLSLDPYMRGRMSDAPHAAPVAVGRCDGRRRGVARRSFAASRLQAGELVLGYTGWQDYALSDGTALTRLDAAMAQPSMALGVPACPASPPTWGCSTSASPRPATPWWLPRRAGGGFGGRPDRRNKGLSRGRRCRRRREVSLRGRELGFDACKIDHRSADFAGSNSPQPAQAASMGTSRTSAALCSMRCCRCSTSARGCRCAA